MSQIRQFFLLLLLCVTLTRSLFGQSQASIESMRVRHSTEKHSGSMQVTLRLTGDPADRSTFARAVVTTCIDDSNQSLIDPRRSQPRWRNLVHNGKRQCRAYLTFQDPAQNARQIKALSGEIEFFIPGNDPNATILMEEFQEGPGVILSPPLEAAGMQIEVSTVKQYEAELVARKKQAAQNATRKQRGLPYVPAIPRGGMLEARPNDVILEIKDPNHRLVGIGFQDSAGEAIRPVASSVLGANEDQPAVFHFTSRLPDHAQMLIYVRTPASIVTMPFAFTNVVLL